MRHIVHSANPPISLGRAVDRGATKWSGFDAKKEVEDVLAEIQKHLCAYCQIRLDSGIGGHVEHIWPKAAHPEKQMEWSNLVASCTHSHGIGIAKSDGGVSCGHSDGKRKWPRYEPAFVSPTEVDCERYFEYTAGDGSVQPARDLTAMDRWRAEYTIDLLNLNCLRLRRLRKDVLEEGYRCIRDLIAEGADLERFLDLEFAEIDGKLRDFVSARHQHFGAFR